MGSKKKEYSIAWILSSHDQCETIYEQFDEPFESYSSKLRITYTTGRVHYHDVVMASPASGADTPSVAIIINDLLLHFPSIKAGFVVSTDASIPYDRRVKVGDIAIGAKQPDMGHGVVYVDSQKTNKEGRLFMARESGNLPAAVAKAMQELADLGEEGVHYGLIASSRQHIRRSVATKIVQKEKDFLCFETAASTLKARPLCLLAGVTNYCGEDGHHSVDKGTLTSTCKAVGQHLKSLTRRIDHHDLDKEPPIVEYFEYEALNLDKPACRLLRLEGGNRDDQLQCHIFQAYLPSGKTTPDDNTHDETLLIPYEALSYCWGSNTLTNTIRVDGKLLWITSNLFEALGYLKHANEDRILWIDAICIDQGNVLERGHQVDIMSRLYRQADEVLIWLGDVDFDTQSLISELKTFEKKVPREARREWTSEDDRYRVLWDQLQNSSPEKQSFLQSDLESLTKNPWFSRVWIIQEVANAKRASLGCTHGWLDARTFAVAPKLLHITPSIQCQAIIDIMPGVSRMSSWFSQGSSLSTLLWRFRESEASDPRDKLYALLGISSDKPFAADYSKTEEAVVKEIMDYFLQGESILENARAANFRTISDLVGSGLHRLILGCKDLNGLMRFAARYTGPLLLEIGTVEYLRYIRSPLLEELVRQNAHILWNQATPLVSFLEESRKIRVTPKLINVSLQKGMGFIPTILDLDRDDIEINDALAIEAISHGRKVLERFLVKYDNKATSTEDFGSQKILRDLQMLKDSFENQGYFVRDSDTLREYLFGHYNPWRVNGAVTIRRDNFPDFDLQRGIRTLLPQNYPQIQATDKVRLEAIHGSQDMIKSFLEQSHDESSWSEEFMEDLMSIYSVEIFHSTRAKHIQYMQVDLWPSSFKKLKADGSFTTTAWKILIPCLSNDQGYRIDEESNSIDRESNSFETERYYFDEESRFAPESRASRKIHDEGRMVHEEAGVRKSLYRLLKRFCKSARALGRKSI